MRQIFADWLIKIIEWRLRFGGSTSSSTAGVLACQGNNDPLKISVQPGSRQSSAAEEIFKHETHEKTI